MSNIRALHGTAKAECGNTEVANELRRLADQVQHGEWRSVRNVICVIDAVDTKIGVHPIGELLETARGIGLLFLAQSVIAENSDE